MDVSSNCINIAMDGSEVKIHFLDPFEYIWVENLGPGDIKLSRSPDIENQESGVIQRPANSSFGMAVKDSTIYILGDSQSVNIVGSHSAENPFKLAGKGGGQSASAKMGYITDGLKCHYSADNEHFTEGWRISDLSGCGNAGMFFFSYPGYSYDGKPTYLSSVNNHLALNDAYIIMPQMNYEQITLEVICQFLSTPSQEVDIISNLDSGGYAIYWNETNRKFEPYIRINGAYRSTQGKTNDYLIHSLAVTYDNAHLRFYVDGIFFDETEIIGDIGFPTANTVLGINTNPNGGNKQTNHLGIGSFNFYAARVYSKALTEEEIAKNFAIDNALFNIK